MNFIKINKKQLITILFIVSCLLGYVFFPAKGSFQYKASFIIFLVVLPFLYDKYFLKQETILKYLVIGDWKKNVKYLGASLLFAFLIIGGIFKFTYLRFNYFLADDVKLNFANFLWYEFVIVSFMVLVYELFFRGFVMRYFLTFLGKWSILVQFLFFIVMISMLWGLPYWFYVTYLVFTPFAGWIFYKTRLLLYSFIGQWFFILIIDATFIALTINK